MKCTAAQRTQQYTAHHALPLSPSLIQVACVCVLSSWYQVPSTAQHTPQENMWRLVHHDNGPLPSSSLTQLSKQRDSEGLATPTHELGATHILHCAAQPAAAGRCSRLGTAFVAKHTARTAQQTGLSRGLLGCSASVPQHRDGECVHACNAWTCQARDPASPPAHAACVMQ